MSSFFIGWMIFYRIILIIIQTQYKLSLFKLILLTLRNIKT